MKKITGSIIFCILAFAAIVGCKSKQVAESNPFYEPYNTPFDVPPFEKIMAKHYIPAFAKGMAQGKAGLDIILKNTEEPSFQNTIYPLDTLGKLLTNVSAVFFGQS